MGVPETLKGQSTIIDIACSDEEKGALKELKETLNLLLGDMIVKFVIYGSRARGDYDSESDIDIAIVVRNLTGELKNKILERVAEIEFKYIVPMSTFVVSEEDFNNLKERERRIAIDIERDGIPI